jgi:ATP-binding cassette subfamily F protein uup
MDSSGQRRLGNNVLKMNNVSLQFGDNKVILDDFSYNFNKGDKLGVVGANGIGKSTFIKVLTGQQPIDSGDIETGETVVFGFYDQMGIEMDENQRVMDFIIQRVEARDGSSMAEAPQEAMNLLKQFQFERSRWNERYVLFPTSTEISIPITSNLLNITLELPCFRGAKKEDCNFFLC